MRIFRSLEEADRAFAPSALTIGNFDGVHAGHRELLRRVVSLASQTGSRPSALTFDPHPTVIVAPERAPRLLTDLDERCELMMDAGLEQVMILPFDKALSQFTPGEFFDQVVVRALGARAVVVGDNFHFGRKQAGGRATLEQMCARAGILVEIVPAISLRGVLVSSSEIRRLLREGRVSKAGRLLGRPYSLTGRVVAGEGRGSRQTVPTLNLDTSSIDGEWKALPANGVYITRTTDLDNGRKWPSITNTGTRPTFGGTHLTVETYLLEPLQGPPPTRIRVEFLRYVREERYFPEAASLRRQILKDVGRAQTWFRRMKSLIPAGR